MFVVTKELSLPQQPHDQKVENSLSFLIALHVHKKGK